MLKDIKEILDKYDTANMYSDSVRKRITSEIRDKLKEMIIDTPNNMELGKKIRSEIMRSSTDTNKKETNNQYDKCVGCGKTTSFSKGHSIEGRLWYVEGAGQLCGKCWDKIYNRHTLTLI